MAEPIQSGKAMEMASNVTTTQPDSGFTDDYNRPTGRIYRAWRIGPVTLPWYASPWAQLLLVSFVCFLTVGMVNALSGLGGAGIGSTDAANKSAIALNSTFSIVAFFGGTAVNKIGVKWSVAVGSLGYCIYTASIFSFSLVANGGAVIFGGVALGFCAGLLWTAQGAIMMSYPEEKNKGKFISVFWIIFNLGAVIGSLIPLGSTINNGKGSTINTGTYVAFIVIMFSGSILACFLLNPERVVRKDGSRVISMKHPTWKSELIGMYGVLKSDAYIVALFPMFWASNWFYTYQINDLNFGHFNIRTRSLNGLLYWVAQMFGALLFGFTLDYTGLKRSFKAKVVLVVLFALTMVVWGGGYAFQKPHTRESQMKIYLETGGLGFSDWTDKGYVGPMFLYIFYGFFDASWQTTVYWLMGSMSNNSRKVSYFAGFYKGIQSAGGAVAAQVDLDATPYLTELVICWALLAGSLVIAAPVIIWKVKEEISVEEDLKFSDETLEDVLAPGSIVPKIHSDDV